MSQLLRVSAVGVAIALAGLALPPAAASIPAVAGPLAMVAVPAVAPPTPAPGSGTGPSDVTSANQAAALWDGFRTAQLQGETLEAQIAQETKQAAQLKGQIAAYSSQIAAAVARQAADTAQITTVDGQLTALEASIVTTTAQATSLQGTVEARVVTIYKEGPASYLAMLLSATSLQDFLSRLNYVDSVIGSDRSQLTQLQSAQATLTQEKAEAARRRTELASAKAAQVADAARLTSLRAGQTQLSTQVAAELAIQNAQLVQVNAQKATYVADMALLAGESSSITTFVRDRQGNEAYTWSGKKLIWPVRGPISSPFGPRIDPIFGTPSFHTGIDIAVDSGLPILAAAPGRVIYAGVMQGYGNVVILDDGGALATLYAHMSVIRTSPGVTVSQGQQIGNIGCTGLCTGPHLHFETRVAGTPVQPLDFLP